jgi:hypothetical protein
LFYVGVSLWLTIGFENCSPPGKISTSTNSSSAFDNAKDLNADCPVADPSLTQPASIDDAVILIRSLPKPLTLNCFLKNLKPPLQVVAVDSNGSAQPSAGPNSPRIFLINYPLIMSIVPAGQGRDKLEFSQVQPPGSSVKGELLFPINEDFQADLPYTRILLGGGGGTNCKACHFNEYQAFRYAGPAYGSDIIAPGVSKQVSVGQLKSLALNCDTGADALRCAILKAVFIDGQAQAGVFPN